MVGRLWTDLHSKSFILYGDCATWTYVPLVSELMHTTGLLGLFEVDCAP